MNRSKVVTEAVEGIQPAIKKLRHLEARCMEQVIDKAGIVVERWLLPNGRSVIVYGTPLWRDVFLPASAGCKWDDTFMALESFSASSKEMGEKQS